LCYNKSLRKAGEKMNKFKKLICITFVLAISLLLTACQQDPADTLADTEPATGGRIAAIRNMTNSDHTVQFFNGIISEGEAFGFTVDTFLSDGDDLRMRTLMEQALLQDYDIWIISHASEGYQYELISRAVEQGVFVTAFDSSGDMVPGVTYTSQDDRSLAMISLDDMIERAVEQGAELPVRFIALNILGMLAPFDIRHSVIEEYIEQGKIELIQMVAPSLDDLYGSVYTAISTALRRYDVGEIHGIWTATSFFLDGVIDAVQNAGRSEIVITAVDISDTEIHRMVTVPEYFSCAAVDPYVIGVVSVRLAVSKMHGLETPQTLTFPAVGIRADQLTIEDTMATLYRHFPDFGSTDIMRTPELEALRITN